MHAPFAEDADGATDPVRFSLAPDPITAGAWLLTESVRAGWLADADRAWPVTVDPDVTLGGPDADCYLKEGSASSSFCGAVTAKSGLDGTGKWRALFDFSGVNSAMPRDAVVLSADLSLNVTNATTTAAASYSAYRLTQDWTNQATWNTADGIAVWTGGAGGAFTSTDAVANPTVGDTTGNREHWYPTKIVQSWVGEKSPAYGFLVKQTSETTSNVASFTSWDSATSANWPSLTIRYVANTGNQPYFSFTSHRLTDRSSVQVNNANGNLLLGGTDLRVSGVGLPLQVDRSYNSQDYDAGPLGPRWKLSVGPDVHVAVQPNGDVAFFAAGGTPYLFTKNGTSFDPPAGVNAKLAGAGTTASPYTVTFNKTGEKLTFDQLGVSGGPFVLTKDEDTAGNAISYGYDASHRLATITDTQGRAIATTYSAANLLTKLTETGTGAATRVWKYGYTSGHLTSFTDPDNKVTGYSYAGDQLTKVTDPVGNQTSIVLNGNDKTAKITYVTNNATGAGDVWTYDYTNMVAAGDECFVDAATPRRKVAVTDPRGGVTRHCADDADKVVRVFDPLNHRQDKTYNANSDVTSLTDAAGRISTLTYDNLNNLTKAQAPDVAGGGAGSGRSSTFSYPSPSGAVPGDFQPTSTTDTQGKCTGYGYDTATRQVADVFAGNTPSGGVCPAGGRYLTNSYEQTTSHSTCPTANARKGELCSTTDGRGNSTGYGYDNAGNLTKVTAPAPLGYTTITPDALGRQSTVKDGVNGAGTALTTTTYSYDGNDRIVQLNYAGTTPGNPPACSATQAIAGSCIHYTYDGAGDLTQRLDNTGTTTFGYDKQNRPTSKKLVDHSSVTVYDTGVGYDATGNVASYTDAGGAVAYRYDAANRVTALTEPGGSCTGYDLSTLPPASARCSLFDYDANGFRTLTRYPSGQRIDTAPDTSGRSASLSMKTPGATEILARSYDYAGTDAQSGLLQVVTEKQPNTGRTGTVTSTISHGYDAFSELTSATVSGARSFAESFGYDNAGNRTTSTAGGVSWNYGYNNADQLCWYGTATGANGTTACPATPAGNTADTYDLAGNQTANGSQSMAYNGKNQTSSVTTGGTPLAFTYADFDSTERTQAGSTRSDFGLLGLTGQTGGTAIFFTRLPDETLVSMRLGTGGTSTNSYYTLDPQGSVLAVTNAAGTAEDALYTYQSFGATITATGSNPTANPYRFQSGLFDGATGLYKYGTRYHNPTVGRWTQRDPIPGDITNPETVNDYPFVGSSPCNNTDPTGRFSFGAAAIGCLGGATAVLSSGTAEASIVFGPEGPELVVSASCVVGAITGGFS